MSRIINIKSDVNGKFIIDENGIRSTGPVYVKNISWNGNTLTLKGINNVEKHLPWPVCGVLSIFAGLASGHIGYIFNKNYGPLIGCTIGSLSTWLISRQITYGSNLNIIVNGRSINKEKVHKPKNVEPTMINERFSSKVELGLLDVEGSESSYCNKLPLAKSASISTKGEIDINIESHNPYSDLIINNNGGSKIQGKGDLKSLMINNVGSGIISGFTVNNKLNISSTGTININLCARPTCSTNQHTTGVSNITIKHV